EQSHDIAKRVRAALAPLAAKYGAAHPGGRGAAGAAGPADAGRRGVRPRPRAPARGRQDGARTSSSQTPGVVDVDWYVEDAAAQDRRSSVDAREGRRGRRAPPTALADAGAHGRRRRDRRASCTTTGRASDVPDRAAAAARAVRAVARRDPGRPDHGRARRSPLGELVGRRAETVEPPSHLPQEPAAGDLRDRRRGRARSRARSTPSSQMNEALDDADSCPRATASTVFNAAQPFDSTKYAMKWDGEWHITYEVFRDLGLAFAAVLVLIYILVVGWFQSFITPLIDHGGHPVLARRHPAGARG
ncbi:MAG: hypothetical protein MZV70_43360, partial [Desulfobacterales bacterium]|nr:hypothetical protein [Desulfobacterales bacterium]